jgi:hypothetical protein
MSQEKTLPTMKMSNAATMMVLKSSVRKCLKLKKTLELMVVLILVVEGL